MAVWRFAILWSVVVLHCVYILRNGNDISQSKTNRRSQFDIQCWVQLQPPIKTSLDPSASLHGFFLHHMATKHALEYHSVVRRANVLVGYSGDNMRAFSRVAESPGVHPPQGGSENATST